MVDNMNDNNNLKNNTIEYDPEFDEDEIEFDDEYFKPRRKVSKAKRKKQKQTLGYVWIIFGLAALVFVGMLIGTKDSTKGKAVAAQNEFALNKNEDLFNLIADNYYQYLKKSYIMIGKYPDCSYVKISSVLKRNTYNVDNYKVNEANGLKNYYEGDTPTAKYAIDVSSYQKKINWETVKASGVETAIIRVGYRGYGTGKIADDERFSTHIEGASKQGFNIGLYFFTQALNYTEGKEEAEYVLNHIGSYNITEPIIIDTEYIYNKDARANNISNEDRTDAIKGFCETIKDAGYTPMIYANRNWLIQNMNLEELDGYEIWLAHYSEKPDFPYEYSAWQYSGEGTVNGVEGKVDLNVWFR